VPFWEPVPCKKVFLEFDLSMRAICHVLAGFVNGTICTAQENRWLRKDLFQRCESFLAGEPLPGSVNKGTPDGVPAWHYRRISPDTWAMYSVLAERFPNQTIEADCDQLCIAWAAFWALRMPRANVRVAASQPRVRRRRDGQMSGYGMAHAYLILDGEPFDPSVRAGMNTPSDPDFYGSGESASVRVSV
jgi:hypothetical protein